ncbi:MAG: hypothetical protein K0R28_2337 [Paenibacillus sp.]|jgi:lysophospholipase L1-like esterase|nr:hypothetical protein [Paenibacillus sp.]
MGEFAVFRRRLQEKAEQASARPVIYVAMGDSVTQGCMEAGVIEHEQVYHQLLKRRIEQRYPTTILSVINAGVSGDSAFRSKARWHRDMIGFQPDLVTIGFGANDVHKGMDGLEPYMSAIHELVQRIRAETEADILLLTPGMMMKADNAKIADVHRHLVPKFLEVYQSGTLPAYVQALKNYAIAQKVPCLDVYAMWEQMESDGVDIHSHLVNGINHPDIGVHKQIADAIEARLFAPIESIK